MAKLHSMNISFTQYYMCVCCNPVMFCTLEASVRHILHYRVWQTDLLLSNFYNKQKYAFFIKIWLHSMWTSLCVVGKIKDLNCHVFQLQAFDPDIRDRTAEQHIVFFVVKEDQQMLLQIARNGCLSQIKVSGIYRYLQ